MKKKYFLKNVKLKKQKVKIKKIYGRDGEVVVRREDSGEVEGASRSLSLSLSPPPFAPPWRRLFIASINTELRGVGRWLHKTRFAARSSLGYSICRFFFFFVLLFNISFSSSFFFSSRFALLFFHSSRWRWLLSTCGSTGGWLASKSAPDTRSAPFVLSRPILSDQR